MTEAELRLRAAAAATAIRIRSSLATPPALPQPSGQLSTAGPGPTGYIDPALYEMGAIGRRIQPDIMQPGPQQEAFQIGDRWYPAGTTPEMAARVPPEMFYNPQSGQWIDLAAQAAARDRGAGDAMLGGAMQGLGFGSGDEVIGGVAALVGGQAQGAFTREQVRATLDADFNRDPAAQIAGQIGGAIAVPMGGAAKFIGAAGTAAGQALRSALVGAGVGGVYGFLDGEGGFTERATNAAGTAALSAVMGAAMPSVTRAVAGLPERVRSLFQMTTARPDTDTLRALKTAAYQAVDDAGEAFSGDELTALSLAVRDAFDATNYVDDVDDASRAVLRILQNREGQTTTLPQLDSIRQNIWQRYSSARDQPRLLDAISAIDRLVDTHAGSSALMGAARAANARFAKTQLIEDAFERAVDSAAATGSGGNVLNRYLQAVSRILGSQQQIRFFSADEQAVMRQFVRQASGGGQGLLRLVGKLSPTGNGLMAMLHALGGVATGGATLPLMAVGLGAKGLAERGVQRSGERLLGMMAGSAPIPPAGGAAPLVPGITGTANTLAAQAAAAAQERIRMIMGGN